MNNYSPKSPKKPILGPESRHFKPKIQIAISSDLCIRVTWNLTGTQGAAASNRDFVGGLVRYVVKQFQDGGRPPFWKSIYRHISVKNHHTFMKFCTQQQILNWMNVTWSHHDVIKNEKVALDRLWVRQNVFLVYLVFNLGLLIR